MMKIENAQFMQECWVVSLVPSCLIHNEENRFTLFIIKWHVCIYITLPLYCCSALKLPAPLIYEEDIIIPSPSLEYINICCMLPCMMETQHQSSVHKLCHGCITFFSDLLSFPLLSPAHLSQSRRIVFCQRVWSRPEQTEIGPSLECMSYL